MGSYRDSWRRYEAERMQRPTCHGCRYLRAETDGAGGGMWFCERSPGIVVGVWGWWERGDQVPRRLYNDCYESRQQINGDTCN